MKNLTQNKAILPTIYQSLLQDKNRAHSYCPKEKVIHDRGTYSLDSAALQEISRYSQLSLFWYISLCLSEPLPWLAFTPAPTPFHYPQLSPLSSSSPFEDSESSSHAPRQASAHSSLTALWLATVRSVKPTGERSHCAECYYSIRSLSHGSCGWSKISQQWLMLAGND